MSDYFEKYTQFKYLKDKKFYIGIDEIEDVEFDREVPEIFYDILNYICKCFLVTIY